MNDTDIIQRFRLHIVEVRELAEDAPEFNSCANITKGTFTNQEAFNTAYLSGCSVKDTDFRHGTEDPWSGCALNHVGIKDLFSSLGCRFINL